MTAPLTLTLVAVDELVVETVVPLDRGEAVELSDTVHTFDDHLHGLHDNLAECLGTVDANGRCIDCGRLVAFAAHKRGGCLMAVPFVGTAMWLFQHREGIPLVGQAIWRHRRRKNRAAGGAP